ncbi:MAG TPA: iron-containing alcohol dehydrogenase [Verrucomicrobiae bacterium]|nr:iron-containing alcohol dehydrogenase [Verrucomicrobiae bacterium]
MSQALMERLLEGRLADPDGGGMLAVPTRKVAIAANLGGRAAALLGDLGLGPRLAVVSDPRTRAVLGERVVAGLGGAKISELVLEEMPKPDGETVARVRAATAEADALVAVGSGTINDLCKYAAFLDRKPYAVFGTAPSMNGYTSVSAAITEHGHKKSLPAAAPVGVFLDLAVLAAAPPRMIRSGLGDSICRPTAQADWLLAHLLLGQTYRRAPFLLLDADEPALLAKAGTLLAGDTGAMELLARTLVLSGFGMTICGGSYPASQGEHLISHYIDMRGDPAWVPSFHGEHIGVTALTMARLQEAMLAGEAPVLSPTRLDEAALIRHFGPELGASCWAAFAKKVMDAPKTAALNARLTREWPEIRAALRRVMRPSAEMAAALMAAGAPTKPADIHIPPAFYRQAVRHAREIRDRYTFLDLAAESGRLDSSAAAA